MYLGKPRAILSQGDIFTKVSLIDSASPKSPPREFDAITLSHNCEIEKPNSSTVLVCAIRPITQLDEGNRGHLRRGRLYNAMLLEFCASLSESFIDFRFIFRVNKMFLNECAQQGLKIASLTDEAQLALGNFFYTFIIRPHLQKKKK